MTIYDWENDHIRPAKVFDTHGKEHKELFRIDTETGEAIQSTGKVLAGYLIRRKIRLDTPIRIEWL